MAFLPRRIALNTRSEQRRWALLAYAGALWAAIALFGVDPTLAVLAAVLNVAFLAYFIRHLSFSIAAARWAETDVAAPEVEESTYTPHVLVIVAAHNERKVIDNLARALLDIRYPASRIRLAVVADNCTDGTGERLDKWHAKHPRLEVMHRRGQGGKSGALNDGIARFGQEADIVVIYDADHEPDPRSVRRVVRHFREDRVGAVMGRCVIRNAGENTMATTIFVDYLSGYLVNEYGRQALYELPAYGGANCAVRKSVLEHIGGFNPESVTEDTDLTLRILAGGGAVRYDPASVDYEEAVNSAGTFWKQRYRWARGHQRCARDYYKELLRTPDLNLAQKIETLQFLLVYHAPVWVMLGVILTLLRAFGIGDTPPAMFIPLGILLFIGPLTELATGLVVGRTERASAWTIVAFIPMFFLTAVLVSWAWLAGMLGLPYSWKKTARSGANPANDDEPLPATRKEQAQERAMVIRTGGRRRVVGAVTGQEKAEQ